MMLHSWFRLAWLLLLPALLVTEISVAQVGIVVVEGQQKSLAVVQASGDSYAWRIYNKPTFQDADLAGTAEVEYTTTNSLPVLPVLWKKHGDYYFTVTVFNSKGCKNMKVGFVKVISSPVSAVAGKDTITGVCNTIILTASKSKGDHLTYRWDLLDPGGVLSQKNSVTTNLNLSPGYSGSFPVTFRILLTVTDLFQVSGTDTVRVTFISGPKVGIIYPQNPNKDGSMLIDGGGSKGMALKYLWTSTKGEIVGDANNPKVLIKGSGIYSLEVTDAFGCSSSKSFQYPFEPDNLIANADYVRTAWTDSIHIHVLNNDFSTKNDFDKRTLSVINKPKFGTAVVRADGTIIYSPDTRKATLDQFMYQICNGSNTCDTALVTIDIYKGPVWIPEAISVNGDGHNEYFVIRGIEDYKNSSLTIYTRAGQMIYRSTDYQNDWAGQSQNSAVKDGTVLPTGTYYYVLHLGGTARYLKGFVYLMH